MMKSPIQPPCPTVSDHENFRLLLVRRHFTEWHLLVISSTTSGGKQPQGFKLHRGIARGQLVTSPARAPSLQKIVRTYRVDTSTQAARNSFEAGGNPHRRNRLGPTPIRDSLRNALRSAKRIHLPPQTRRGNRRGSSRMRGA